MLTVFIIPFGFVYNTQLMAFPNLSWDMVWPVALLISLQWTTSVLCYGHFLSDLGIYERAYLGITTLAGFIALINHGMTANVVNLALLGIAVGWTFATRGRGLSPRAAE